MKRINENEALKVLIPESLRCLLIEEMQKYIEALKLEYEFTDGSKEMQKDIEIAECVLFKITAVNVDKIIEVDIQQLIILDRMLYCSITAIESLGGLNKTIEKEYKRFYKSIEELVKEHEVVEIEGGI